MAQAIVGDAKVSLIELSQALGSWKADDSWYKKSQIELKNWDAYVDKESGPTNQKTSKLCSSYRSIAIEIQIPPI